MVGWTEKKLKKIKNTRKFTWFGKPTSTGIQNTSLSPDENYNLGIKPTTKILQNVPN